MGALWLRWTWRDLRVRWIQVLATALVLVGIGAFAGLGGLRDWRERSADRSLAAMRAHDLRVNLPDGAFLDAGLADDPLEYRETPWSTNEEQPIRNLNQTRPAADVSAPAGTAVKRR